MNDEINPEILKLSEVLAAGKETPTDLGEWDAGDDNDPIPPRHWLLGNIFCRRSVSSLLADGGTGKTALRVAQALSLATGRNLTGAYVFQRCRVLLISLEDDKDELRRRVKAAQMHHGISDSDLKGWLFLAAPGGKAGKLMFLTRGGPRSAVSATR
ncbi:AAA family ATPase [Mesorhizobium muleiense]|uniref:AAA family ATPase n=1 Tax=Mesorhizobium muleiense TaxID=1004279 RepID=UPI003AFAD1A4